MTVSPIGRARLDFAQRCLVNAQELTRYMDQKAGAMLAAIGLLTASLGAFAATVLREFHTTISPTQIGPALVIGPTSRYVVLAGLPLYFFFAFGALFHTGNVIAARTNRVGAGTDAPRMLFPLML